MVILSVAIVNRSGKALVARQFRDISRIRIEGLLTAFPKLIQPNSEHTFVETDTVRYVYTPMEALYLVLVTSKNSNIVEDLDTLQMITRVVKDTCSSFVTEDGVIDQAFELMMAFDEMISMGFREKLEMDQIHNILQMESHEEILQNMIRQSEIEDAIARGRNKAAEIAVDKAKNQGKYTKGIGSSDTSGGMGMGGGSGGMGIGSGGMGSGAVGGKYTGISSQAASMVSSSGGISSASYAAATSSSSSSSGGSGGMMSTAYGSSKPTSALKPPTMKLFPSSTSGKGGAGGKSSLQVSSKNSELLREMAKGEDISLDDDDQMMSGDNNYHGGEQDTMATPQELMMQQQQQQQQQQQVPRKTVHIQIEEKFRAEVNHEGGAKIDLKGEMFLCIQDESSGAIRVQIESASSSPSLLNSKQYTVKTHPKIDKQLYTENLVIGLKSAKRPFPAGNLKVLTWRMQEEDESHLPFTVSCWPSEVSEGLSVNVEYELVRKDISLNNVVIAIPIPDTENVNVESIEHGHYKLDAKNQLFLWYLDNVDESIGNVSGSLEFVVSGVRGDDSSCFPVHVQFSSQKTLIGASVGNVVSAIDGKPVDYSKETLLQVAEYTIV